MLALYLLGWGWQKPPPPPACILDAGHPWEGTLGRALPLAPEAALATGEGAKAGGQVWLLAGLLLSNPFPVTPQSRHRPWV